MLLNYKFLGNKFVKTTTLDLIYLTIVYMYMSFLSPYLSTIGWSEALKGVFFAIFGFSAIFINPILGAISDKIGRFKLIMFGLIGESINILILTYVQIPIILLPLRIFSAIVFFSVTLTAFSRINDTVKKNNKRSEIIGIFQSIVSIAILISPLLGGLIADTYGYKTLFLITFFLMILFILFVHLFDELFYNKTSKKMKKKLSWKDFNYIADIKTFLKFKELRYVALVGVSSNFVAPLIFLVLPYIIMQQMHLSNFYFSLVIFTMGIANLSQYYFGKIIDKKGKRKNIFIGLLIFSLGLITLFFAKTFIMLLVILFIMRLGTSLGNVATGSYMSDIGEKYNVEGKIIGSYIGFAKISSTISYIISGALLISWGEKIFLLYGGIIFLSLIITAKFFLNPSVPKKEKCKKSTVLSNP